MTFLAESPVAQTFASLGLQVFERGWLSANNVLFTSAKNNALVDSGYCSHADQTLALLKAALADRPLHTLCNTHLHSDHCGGNAAIQAAYRQALQTYIPPGESAAVQAWDEAALSYQPTGQNCPRFGFTHLLNPSTTIQLGASTWQIHAAPGHDTHAVLLFQPDARVLISGDALWENGFGVVFPELVDGRGFADVADTLDLIESLQPHCVIPGHGTPFTDIAPAIQRARSRLSSFVADPVKHAAYAAKVLLKFHLLEIQSALLPDFLRWATNTPYMPKIHSHFFAGQELHDWLHGLCQQLHLANAAKLSTRTIENR